MSRFDDDPRDEDFPNQSELWWANTERALKGKRGKAFLRELETALVELPEKKLIEGLICKAGQVCAMGAFALKRRRDAGQKIEDALKWLEDNAPQEGYANETGDFMSEHFGVLRRLAIHGAYVNDEEVGYHITPEARYEKVLAWVRETMKAETSL